jgi:NusA-like KH domain protein
MVKRILSTELMSQMAIFQSITKVDLKDCFIDEQSGILTFVVADGTIGKALGKKASNVKLLETKLKKKIRVVEYKSEVKSFIKSLLFPLKVADVTETDGIIEIMPTDIKSRGLIIGRNASNLRNTEKIAQRFFKVDEIKVAKPEN